MPAGRAVFSGSIHASSPVAMRRQQRSITPGVPACRSGRHRHLAHRGARASVIDWVFMRKRVTRIELTPISLGSRSVADAELGHLARCLGGGAVGCPLVLGSNTRPWRWPASSRSSGGSGGDLVLVCVSAEHCFWFPHGSCVVRGAFACGRVLWNTSVCVQIIGSIVRLSVLLPGGWSRPHTCLISASADRLSRPRPSSRPRLADPVA